MFEHKVPGAKLMLLAGIVASGIPVSVGAQSASPAGQASAPAAAPRFNADRVPRRAALYYGAVWGIDSLGVKYTESGEIVRFSYRVLDPEKAQGAARGAYVLEEASSAPRLILIGTGSEVHLALAARAALEAEGIPTRVVSMPCWEVFEKQTAAYREEVLPAAVTARVSIEAGTTFGWQKWVGLQGASVGLDHFGASGPGDEVLAHFGFTAENVVSQAQALLARVS